MAPTELNRRLNYARQLNIRFLGPVQSTRWPETHTLHFSNIQKAGLCTYDAFVEEITNDTTGDRPWRHATRNHADRLCLLAETCYREHRQEAGWRMGVENEILHRFTIEVACTDCRNRLWASEIPAALGREGTLADELEERRCRRRPCQCPRLGGQSQYDRGINMLFSDRAEAAIKHNPGLPVKPRPGQVQNYESPDRVYGLKETADFQLLLNGADKRAPVSTRSLRDTVEFSPFNSDGDPLLYPFLILEAKSSKGDDHMEAQMQTAFVIRRLLNLQSDLKRAAGEERQWETGPLVWFISWRAEQWSISAAFIECDPEDTICYMVVDLWTGNIRYKDGALQLLLIIDYIFDWARDIYRHSIMRDLHNLSTNNLSETDPLYYSMAGRGLMKTTKSSMRPIEISDRGNVTQSTKNQLKKLSFTSLPPVENLGFLNIVLPEGVIRDASILESRFLALQLNENDVDTFLASFNSDDEAADWTRKMLEYQPHAWKVAPGTIQELERISTGNFHTSGRGDHPDEMSFLNLAIHFHMSPTWQPVRQITCISFSEAALNLLVSRFGIDCEFSHQPQVAVATITDILLPIFNQSVIDYLTDAVSMVCLSSCFSSTDREKSRPMVLAERPEEHYAGLEPTNSPHLITLVTAVYENHRIGRREPSDPYLSFSCCQLRHDKLHPISNDRTSGNLLPLIFAEGQWGVLVDAILQEGNPPKRCLYLFGKFSEYEDFPGLLRRMLKESMYSMTKLISIGSWHEENSRHLNRRISLDEPWKSKADPESFDKWLRNLEAIWKQHDSARGHSASSPIIID